MIQSPITPTKITTGLSTEIGLADEIITVTGITSIYSADLIKINDEIMRVNAVGVLLNSAFAVRMLIARWMGTRIQAHEWWR